MNILYEKTSRPPPAGSLREAVFLYVWLKRQDAEVQKTRLIVQTAINQDEVPKVYKEYLQAVYPFAKEMSQEQERKLKERIEKEVARGPILFRPIDPTTTLRHTPVNNMPKNIVDILRKNAKTRGLNK